MRTIKNKAARWVAAAGVCIASSLLPAMARANQYGELHITNNTTLNDDRFGSVIFDADDITLNCAGHQIHFSSFTKNNCFFSDSPSTARKCAVKMQNRRNVGVVNCFIVGSFDAGTFMSNSNTFFIQNVESNGPGIGFDYEDTSFGMTEDTKATGNRIGMSIVRDRLSVFTTIDVFTPSEAGFSIKNSDGTSIGTASVYSSASLGVLVQESNQVNLSYFRIEDAAGSAVRAVNSPATSLGHSSLARNSNGVDLINTVSAGISFNVAVTDSGCDATADSTSTNGTWTGNSFRTSCNNVPSVH